MRVVVVIPAHNEEASLPLVLDAIPAGLVEEIVVVDNSAAGAPGELQIVVEDEMRFAICAADGTQMGLAPNREIAFAAIRQHELEPLSVH